MADLNSLFNSASTVGDVEDDYSWLVIDHDFRTIDIPPNKRLLGVTSDERVNILHFSAPRYYEGSDLSTFVIRIVYLNARNEGDLYLVDDVEAGEDEMTFSWEVGRHACMYSGNVNFIVSAVTVDSNGYILQKYNTRIHTLPVVQGLETENEVYFQNYDVITQFFEKIQRGDQIDQYVSDVEAYSIGTRGGEPLEEDDPAYHNNAKYYSDQMMESIEQIIESSYDAEAWARGTRNGVLVDEMDVTYRNNSRFYMQEADNILASKVDILYNEESGETVHFVAASEGTPMRSIAIDVEPQQNLKGYDYPWPTDGGKNKLKVTVPSQSVNGFTVAVQDDFRIGLNGMTSAITYLPVWNNIDTTAMAGKIFYANAIDGVTWRIADQESTDSLQDLSNETVITDNGTGKRLLCRIANGLILSDDILSPMILDDIEEDTTYSPNSNFCSISGTEVVTVTRAEATENYEEDESVSIIFSDDDIPYKAVVNPVKGTVRYQANKITKLKSDFGLVTVSNDGYNYRQADLTDEFLPLSKDDWDAARTTQLCNCGRIADPNTETEYGEYVAVVYWSEGMTDPVLRISDQLYSALSDTDVVEVYYQIAEPYTERFEKERLNVLQGDNYVWTNCAGLTLEYPIDLRRYVDEEVAGRLAVVEIEDTDVVLSPVVETRYICGEIDSLTINSLPMNGIVDIIFESGSTPTVLTLPNTVLLPAWFTVGSNETIELNILDGKYGSVQVWA